MKCPFKININGKFDTRTWFDKNAMKEIVISVNNIPVGIVQAFDIQPVMVPINFRPRKENDVKI